MAESYLNALVNFHLRFNPLYHDADLRARHLDAIERAVEAVRDMPKDMLRVKRFMEVYEREMADHDQQTNRTG